MRADGRKRGGALLGVLAVVIAVAAAVAALAADDDATTSPTTGTATSHDGTHDQHRSVSSGAPGPGVVAPAFDVADLDGNGRIKLADYRGRPVVLTFWAAWCSSCRAEFPRLNALVHDHEDDDLAVIGITYRDIPSDSREFAKDFDAQFTLGLGGDGDPVAADYGIRAIPQLYFIDRGGVIRERIFGSPSRATIDAAVAEITPR